MEYKMDQKMTRLIVGIMVILALNLTFIFAQEFSIKAGNDQIINWEKTKSLQL